MSGKVRLFFRAVAVFVAAYTTMPPELRKAHQQNDKAVMQAYGFWGKLNSESECVAELMKMYQELTANK